MDRLSYLPEAVLSKILSLLPAKDIVATMVLSKQWQFLWTFVPKLVYDYHGIEYGRFTRFVDRSLFLHEAPVIEKLDFKLGRIHGAGDIRVWIKAMEKRCVRKLIIEFDTCSSNETPVTLPRNLYTCGRMLVTLKLSNAVLVDDAASSISFPSLKQLSLVSIKYPGDEFVKRLLDSCPVLEDLNVDQCPDDNVTIFTVKVPSLKSLSFYKPGGGDTDGEDGLAIDAPSLEEMKLFLNADMFCIIENEMPCIAKAVVFVSESHPVEILSSITSVKHLTVCLPSSMDAYSVGSIFHSLVHLKVCTCEPEWLNLLMRLLGDSPKLQSIRLQQLLGHIRWHNESHIIWTEPSSVPECLLSSLETLQWFSYQGKEEEQKLAAFILRSARCLKKVTISPRYRI